MAELPKAGGRYTKLEKGETCIRIIDEPITGWIVWTESEGKKHPNRAQHKEELPQAQDAPKFFMAFKVWNHKSLQTEILEVTQKGIQEVIFNLPKNPKWGDPRKYDITITRTGEGMETKYSVVPEPPSDLDELSLAAVIEQKPLINLAALLDGDDPFAAS